MVVWWMFNRLVSVGKGVRSKGRMYISMFWRLSCYFFIFTLLLLLLVGKVKMFIFAARFN